MVSPARARAHAGNSAPKGARANDDFYATQYWVTRALCRKEKFTGDIWEPAAGECDMAHVLRANCPDSNIWISDIVPRSVNVQVKDFLAASALYRGAKNIVTNPPFKLFNEFAEHAVFGLKPPGKICLFAPLYVLETPGRYNRIFSKHPPSRVWTFIDRPAFVKGGKAPEEMKGVQAFCWLVWERTPPADGMFKGGWVGRTV